MNFPYSLLRLVGVTPLGFERFRLKWRRKYKRVLLRPVCKIKGHSHYDSNDWGGGNRLCTRCDYYKPLWRPDYSNDGGKTWHKQPLPPSREF